MTFKSASESRATQRQAKRVSDEGSKPAPWAVVGFRRGRSNKGKPCVYRRVWSFRDWNKGRAKFHAEIEGGRFACLGFVTLSTVAPCGYVLEHVGHLAVAVDWIAQRKGVNRDAHPWLSGTYMRRECAGDTPYSIEGRDLTADRMAALPGTGEGTR